MYYEPPERRRPARRRSILDSPIVAGALVVVVLGLVAAIVVIPGVLPRAGGSGATARPASPTASAAASVAPTLVRPTPSPAPTFLTYRVRTGDSLNSIAKKFRTTARSIAWWNRVTYPSLDPESRDYDPDTIRVGWVLNVLPDTVVDEDDPPTLPPAPEPVGTDGA